MAAPGGPDPLDGVAPHRGPYRAGSVTYRFQGVGEIFAVDSAGCVIALARAPGECHALGVPVAFHGDFAQPLQECGSRAHRGVEPDGRIGEHGVVGVHGVHQQLGRLLGVPDLPGAGRLRIDQENPQLGGHRGAGGRAVARHDALRRGHAARAGADHGDIDRFCGRGGTGHGGFTFGESPGRSTNGKSASFPRGTSRASHSVVNCRPTLRTDLFHQVGAAAGNSTAVPPVATADRRSACCIR